MTNRTNIYIPTSKIRGFTFLEVLLAISIFSFGAIYIFTIFSNTSSAMRHLGNRATAFLIMDTKVWDAKAYLDTSIIPGGYNLSSKEGNNPEFNCKSNLSRLEQYSNMYKLDLNISWREQNKNISLNRIIYLKKKT